MDTSLFVRARFDAIDQADKEKLDGKLPLTCFYQQREIVGVIVKSQLTIYYLLLPSSQITQIIRRFGIFRFISFTTYSRLSRYVAKEINLKILKHLIIENEGSIC